MSDIVAPISPQEAAKSRALAEDVNNSFEDLMKRIDRDLELNYIKTPDTFLFELSEDDYCVLVQGKAMLKLAESYQEVGWKTIELKKPAGCGAYLEFTPGNE